MLLTTYDKISMGSKRSFTDEGYLIVKDARIARTGMQDYLAIEMQDAFASKKATDRVSIYRPEEEVFDQESMKSFEGKPVTNNHPATPVTIKNYKSLSVGTATNIRRDGIFLVADLMITDLQAIKDIESGKRELSNGYRHELDLTSGVTEDGVTFDAIQRQIRGNHIAIVDAARCGPQCSISDSKTHNEETTMRVIVQGVPFEIADEALGTAVQKLSNEHESIVTEKTKLVASHDNAVAKLVADKDAEVQTLQAQLDEAKNNEMTPEKLDAVVEDRMSIVASAKKFITNFDSKGKTCMAIKREVLVGKFGQDLAPKLENDVYVNARFDALVESADVSTSPTEKLIADSVSRSGTKSIESMDEAQIARTKRLIHNRIAHHFPPGARAKGNVAYQQAFDAEYKRVFDQK